ncbi:putative membrane protein YccC [Cytobacillus eiseniae]|uniref:Membrane protein YccC n=2 Tax=Cytobacillus eiseniae TaxID=762947 RepID=A0ABS4RA49_9BACI|nr:DUF2651 family protein [Cytobacillus eiseniae]MBP2239752.1 putative membrane protein YccC [Cytobacillus eiseniae]
MEFIWVLVVCPIIVAVTSIIGYILVRRWFVMPLITFIVFTIFTFTIFNETFIIWVVVYTILSVIISLMMKFVKDYIISS